jgi:hypothetical protein
MNAAEQKLLEGFLGQLVDVPQIQKDRAAAAMIEAAFERQPNAAYLVVQRALLLQEALEASQAEVARLRDETPPARQQAASSFLASSAWGRRAAPARASGPQASAPVRAGTGMGGLLGQAAAMAAGVAGGAFLFQGLNGLFGNDAPASADASDGAHQLTDSSWGDAGPDMDAGFDSGDFLA